VVAAAEKLAFVAAPLKTPTAAAVAVAVPEEHAEADEQRDVAGEA